MEEIRSFNSGINQDFSPLNQPEGTYRSAINFVQLSDEGNLYALTNEEGTTLLTTSLPIGFLVMGSVVLNNEVFVALANPDGASQIGYISLDGAYTRSCPSINEGGDVADINNELGFSVDRPVSMQARIRLSDQRMLYFCDGPGGINMSFLNADDVPAIGEITDNIKIVPNQSIPTIDLDEIKEISGNLRVGAYFITSRYYTADLTPTSYGIPSAMIPITNDLSSGGRDQFDGDYADAGAVNKAIAFTLNNLDLSFPFLEVVIVRFEGDSGTFNAEALPLKNIVDTSMDVVYSGNELGLVSVTQAELNTSSISYSSAKSVVQKDSVLFWSNLADNSSKYDADLQKFANNITIGYTIDEIEYRPSTREEEGNTDFDIVLAYVPEVDNPLVLYLLFNSAVHIESTAALVNQLVLETSGTLVSPLTITGNVDDVNDTTLLTLTFDIADLANGISVADTLNINAVSASTGDTLTKTGIVIGTSSIPEVEPVNNGAFNDYKSEHLTFYKKGYQRGEVYALGLIGNFNDASPSFNYAIPGNNKVTTVTTEAVSDTPGLWAGNTTGRLGTYVSAEDNPTKQNYPGDGSEIGDDTLCHSLDESTGTISEVTPSNRMTRHFKMPTLSQEPHFRFDAASGKTYLRVLGINIRYNSVLPGNIREEMQSMTITRQRRNNTQNKTIYAQGLVNRYCQIYTKADYEGTVDEFSAVWKKMPFINNTNLNNNNTINMGGLRNEGRSTSFDVRQGDTPTGGTRDTGLSLEPCNERMAFHSPESQLNSLNPNNIEGAQLKPVLRMSVSDTYTEFKPSKQIAIAHIAYKESKLRYYYKAWMYANFGRCEPLVGTQTTNQILDARYIPSGGKVTVDGMVYDIDNSLSSKHMYLHVNNETENAAGIPNFGLSGTQDITFAANVDRSAASVIGLNAATHVTNNDRFTSAGSITNNLFNLESVNDKQYGNISGATYIPVVTIQQVPSAVGEFPNTIYGGDVFISKFSYRNYDIYEYKGAYNTSLVAIRYTNEDADYHDQAMFVDRAQGADLKCLVNYFVESTVNCNYRHRYQNRADPTVDSFEPTYFPRTAKEDVLQSFCFSGDSRGYNPQYSFENKIKTYSNKLAAQITVGAFPNRTIHSNKAIADELLDSYRIYKQNSYYDLPKNTGEIWNSFVYNNTLFLHTPKSLWRTYVNDVTQQATSIGEVVMGTGGLFSMPAKEMIVSTGGYGGTISQWAGVVTPYAYYFPDVLQGKMFMLQGDQLREISQKGLQQFFHNNLATGLVNGDGSYNDNPFTGAGLLGAYDFEKKRYLTSKTGTDNDFTVSYGSITESWVSFHTYQPNLYISQNTNLFAIVNDGTAAMYQHNNGPYGVFYTQPVAQSTLDMIFNKSAGIDKVWDNMKMHTVSNDNVNNIVQQFDTWSALRVHSDTRSTGWYDLVVTNAYGSKAVNSAASEVRVRRLNNKFNLTIPADVVIDDGIDIHEPTNLDPTARFKPRMKGDHVEANFVYNNTDNYEFIVNFIATTFRPNHS